MNGDGVNGWNMTFDNLRFVFYTNEYNIHFVELTLTYFFRYMPVQDLKISVISNKLPNKPLPFSDKVEYLSGNVEFDYSGRHFAKTFVNTLPKIKEDYIFFFCDDYFLVAETKVNHLTKLLEFIKKHDVDYFGFDDAPSVDIDTFHRFDHILEEYPTTDILIRNNQYRYLFSVQPCIWKTQSMYNLLNKHSHISLHDLDETLDEIKNSNQLLALYNMGQSWFSHNDESCQIKDIKLFDYFVLAYVELVRSGVFFVPENGFHLSKNYSSVKFIYELIDEFQLKSNPEFKQLLFKL